LPLWIILIAVRSNKPKSEVQQDLVEFISDNAPDFTNWLWQEAPKICTKPEPQPSVMQEFQEEEKPKVQPKVKSAVVVKKNIKQNQKSENLIKKAIGDAHKSATQEHNTSKAKEKGSSYVTTNKDGRKIISLKKSEVNTRNEDDEQGNDQNQDQKTDYKHQANRDVFKRLKPKGKEHGKESSNLDISLDSVIQKQKQKEMEENTREWVHGGGRKRQHYDVTEENIYDPSTRKRPKRTEEPEVEEDINIKKKKPFSKEPAFGLTYNDKNFPPKEIQQDEGEGEGAQDASGGYKGKKKIPYYNMMGYMPPSIYGYPPMYPMDPYMMNPYYGYKPKKFKNKTLVVKKDDKVKPSTAAGAKSAGNAKPGNPADKSNAAPSSVN